MSQGIYNFCLKDEDLKDLLKKTRYTEYDNMHNNHGGGADRLDISISRQSQQCIVYLSGCLNTENIKRFHHIMDEISTFAEEKVIIDCSGLLSISSAGLSLFARLAREFKEKITLRYVCKKILSLFDVSGLNRILVVSDKDLQQEVH